MKLRYSLFLFIGMAFTINSQNISGSELLEKAINYHDPSDNWPSFSGNFKVTMTTPNQSPRVSDINISLPTEFFSVTANRDGNTQTYTVDKSNCSLFYNTTKLDEATAKEKKMTCERANMYKNYYTYLYGLPMKLKDKGTNINAKVERKTFKGKDYLVLKATYDKAVGSDVWYFYFDPETYAMEVYQFYKTDDKGNVKPDSGEYILLTDEETVNGIKMPKVRAWYYNKDDKYLGTDSLGN
ncbi:hypothetical protein BTO05_09855 [Winogradskyella sp. PC-19]|uniref:DUF6503 family protein n=1 Tax=unclassified Winogradskyella TaxID=2615021 RepID=UPI000B3C18D3|nr:MULTISPECIES: DUF6503 family protein [unclassified Winogradskyella]ARV09924.1 hypothetical protein BTO05_09855 [Winogradskyella sp. PC-19]RZN75346.1 MAG: hypothetical protein EVB12_07365 [Winogradskyella sp.]